MRKDKRIAWSAVLGVWIASFGCAEDATPTLEILTTALPTARVGQPYGVSLVASGVQGRDALTWSQQGLPEGLELDLRGAIQGEPASAGEFEIHLAVTSSFSGNAQRVLRLEVQAVLDAGVDANVATCDRPVDLSIEEGSSVVVEGTITGPPRTDGACISFDAYAAAAVYRIKLDSTAHLSFDFLEGDGMTGAYLSDRPCGGASRGCLGPRQTDDVDVLPGPHFLNIEGFVGGRFRLRIYRAVQPPRPASDTCRGAIPLSFVGDLATFSGDTAGAEVETFSPSVCFAGPVALYYRLTVEEESFVSVETERGDAELLAGDCGAAASIACGGWCLGPVPPGGYLLRMTSDNEYDSRVAGIVTRTPVRSHERPKNDSCEDATPIAVGHPVTVTMDGASGDRSDGCVSGEPDRFFVLELAQRSDVTLRILGGSGLVSLLAGDCGSPGSAACASSFDPEQRLYGVQPGHLRLAAAQRLPGDCITAQGTLAFSVDAEPARPPPPNRECGNAQIVSVSGARTTPISGFLGPPEAAGPFGVHDPAVAYYQLEVQEDSVLTVRPSDWSDFSQTLKTSCGATEPVENTRYSSYSLRAVVAAGSYILSIEGETGPFDLYVRAESP
ncbi:MAG: hypothetical protein HYV07_31115 [Deltaproteobacteria bacterium]|nr:hypothetical protein [Deltaproteobacteria bacterium]